jgi:hypothetical protein
MEYIFTSDRIYPKRLQHGSPLPQGLTWHEHGGCLVESGTLICYDVEPAGNNNIMRANTWTFKVRGFGDMVFQTHYDWALSENTVQNHACITAAVKADAALARAKSQSKLAHSLVKTVGRPSTTPVQSQSASDV